MKEQNWNDIEWRCESICNSVDTIDESITEIESVRLGKRISQLLDTISNEANNIRYASDRVYSTCEDDYADTNSNSFRVDDWEQLTELLPDPTLMSAGEMDSLLETIKEWRHSNGYPREST